MLQHATRKEGSDQPDQLAIAIYIHGRWYDLGIGQLMEAGKMPESPEEQEGFSLPNLPEQIIRDILDDTADDLTKIRSLDDVLDLFTVNIRGGEIVEIPSNGLEEIVVPEPTPADEVPYGTITPGKKSRPKVETETEAATQTEAVQETEQAA